jgi:hypothetical protein
MLLGFHTISGVEAVTAASSITIIGNTATNSQTGMTVTLRN